MKHDDWAARMFADKAIKAAVQKEIETLALVVLGNNELVIDFSEEGFDPYPSCRNWEKKYCREKKRKYRGKFRIYAVFGNTKTDIYLEVLKCLANNESFYIPITSWNRPTTSRTQEEVIGNAD